MHFIDFRLAQDTGDNKIGDAKHLHLSGDTVGIEDYFLLFLSGGFTRAKATADRAASTVNI
jgi:hypothetical protein